MCIRDRCDLLVLELDLDRDLTYDMKPKEIVALSNDRLGRDQLPEDVTREQVAAEARSIRGFLRMQPAEFFLREEFTEDYTPNDIMIARLLAKPASLGGFATAAAFGVVSTKAIDTKGIVSGGAVSVDGSPILPSAGFNSSLDHDMETLFRLFKSAKAAEKIGDTTFSVTEREQVRPGTMLLTGKSGKCSAKLAAILTPKMCYLGVYEFAGRESEEATMELFMSAASK
eukprot:TRINITY_DN6252_c0_g1_i3.p1 TRINITY_DN6252_c0_g1~~TRINITY_DN6252_c0_g1_i3.p1  ORF type:complete len:228 (-),score=53.00 TRINITY_DN6252_c0_g1_i3:2-685(-)